MEKVASVTTHGSVRQSWGEHREETFAEYSKHVACRRGHPKGPNGTVPGVQRGYRYGRQGKGR